MECTGEPIFLVGPTAVGKSEAAILLAEEWNAEIVSADSMQVYLGMDIGTAKPTKDDRSRIPHHLIDVAEPDSPFNVARYCALARQAINQIKARNRLPLIVGGSGMYLRALTEGLFEGPGADQALRKKLESQTTETLWSKLQEIDPNAAAKLEPHNRRRVIRAIEVFSLSGKPISEHQRNWLDHSKSNGPKIPKL